MDTDRRYPIKRAGKQVGYIAYDTRGERRCWVAYDTRSGHLIRIASASSVALTKALARYYFDTKTPDWLTPS